MEKVTIHLLSVNNAEEILNFELENRAYFESQIPGRPDAYYDLDFLKEILAEIEDEQEADQRYMYIVRDQSGTMIGRVNLFSIERGPVQKAEVGYRIGQRFTGKGYATEAVRLILKEAFAKYRLHRIEAGTSPANIGSQIVLIKNGFQYVGRAHECIQFQGRWEDGLLFERIRRDTDAD